MLQELQSILEHLPIAKITIVYIFLFLMYGWYFYSTESIKIERYGYFKSLIPPDALSKKSFKIDILFFFTANVGLFSYVIGLLQGLVYLEFLPIVLSEFNLYSTHLSVMTQHWLSNQKYGQYILFFIAFLIYDFSAYSAHLMTHKSKYLWEFHKVHHYGEQLTYLSGSRMHPIDAFITSYIPKIMVALFISLLQPINGSVFNAPYNLFPKDSFILFALVIATPELLNKFNHTHYPISFGKFLDRIFVSPAFHTIHHSQKIMGNNFGATLAIWDTIFRTSKLPTEVKDLKNHPVGVYELGDNYFSSFADALFKPFRNVFQLAKYDLTKIVSKK
jgi:sterol desaturase/sphingolipid hydroxylase (fatty acid hydroxylase superfamily)